MDARKVGLALVLGVGGISAGFIGSQYTYRPQELSFERLNEVRTPGVERQVVRLSLNDADASELATLPGIGPSLAERIIEYREQEGPFQSVDDMVNVSGIGPTRLEQLRPLVRVD